MISSADPFMWRRESNRQQEVVFKLEKEYRVSAKSRRAKDHNKGLSPAERRTIPRTEQSDHTQEAGQQVKGINAPFETRFDEGGQVWLFMEKVKPGLKKKLAHR